MKNDKMLKLLFSSFSLHLRIFTFMIVIQFKEIILNYYKDFTYGDLTENGGIIDITDYHNIYLLILSDNSIYTGIPPNKIGNTTSTIINITSVATLNQNVALLACTKEYLLSKIDLGTLSEVSLVTYDQMNLSIESLNYTCSLSILENTAYIGITQIVNEEVKNSLIKIDLISEENNPVPYSNEQIKRYNYNYSITNYSIISFQRQISCEVISPISHNDESRLVCGYIKYINNSYRYYTCSINSEFNKLIQNNYQVTTSKAVYNIRLQKENDTFIRYFLCRYSYEIYLDASYKFKKIPKKEENPYLYYYIAFNNSFYFHNDYIFSTYPQDMNNIKNFYLIIKSNRSENYFRLIVKNQEYLHRSMGYYDKTDDKFILFYQYLNVTKYVTLQNISFLFDFECQNITVDSLSNRKLTFNATKLIKYPLQHENLFNGNVLRYLNLNERIWSYDKNMYKFDEASQILTVNTSLNEWIIFYFYFSGGTINSITLYFVMPQCIIKIKTCAFKCRSCSQDFNTCDEGICKSSFAMLRDSVDKDCYPNDQNMPNYLYDNNTNFYEKCYSSCKFCSKNISLSSNLEHNCLTCNEGYLKSYEYMGNCYKIEYPLNESNFTKNISNQENENYTIMNSCLDKYIINDTGECVSQCPSNSIFKNFTYKYINFSLQENTNLGKMFTLSSEDPPSYLLGNKCYRVCPKLSQLNENTNLCHCIYGWEQNSTTKEITCYENKEYCLSKNYYYHIDTKECALGSCRENYYQFNFECYKDNCPDSTSLISSNPNKCESNFNYCYIDENFKTHCSDQYFDEYNFRYNNTKIYFKSCNDSLNLYGVKTYLYLNACYDNCPEETINNDTDNKCSCKYYKMYLNKEKSEYECLKESETCEEKGKISIKGLKECIENLDECINENHKTFNNECYNECPENSETNSDNECLCQYNYYKENNTLKCFNSTTNCEAENYPYKKFNTSECFKAKDECIQRNFKIFNNICYEECPENTELKNNANICSCSYFYFNNNNTFDCFDENINCSSKNLSYTNTETKECFNKKEDCISSGYKIFNNECPQNCPVNTEEKEGNLCLCSNYFINNNDILECFGLETNCISQGYYQYDKNKECFKTKEDCINKGYKIFNQNCYDECPLYSEDKNNNSICECSNYFYNNGSLNCFSPEKTCENEGYEMEGENKECFNSIEDCISKGNSYYYNRTCFKLECPLDMISLGSLENTQIKSDLIKELNLLNNLNSDKLCICNTFTNSSYIAWINNESNPSIQTCLSDCPEDYEIDELTNKCSLCSRQKHYIFNNNCYRNGCPEGTELNESNPSSRACICEELSEYDNETGLITCKKKEYPSEYYEDKKNCPFIYRGDCYLKCPENTCLTQKEGNLTICVKITPNMKVFNGICFEEMEKITKNISNMEIIKTQSGISIYGYNIEENIDDLTQIYSNMTIINLDSCYETLKKEYNLNLDAKIYVLVIETPNFDTTSIINNYDFEIYLENGTQLQNLSSIMDSKIIVSSYINNPEIIKLEKGKEFKGQGYDIYNRDDLFYTSNCAPASDNGNDITLSDRINYYYPSNTSICNLGCEYNSVDYETQRIICECTIDLNNSINNEEKNGKENYSYLDYFLTLINYKIFICYDLFFKFSSFYYNAGFYISFGSLLVSVILMSLFWLNGITKIRRIFYNNIPKTPSIIKNLKKHIQKNLIDNPDKNTQNTNRIILPSNIFNNNLNLNPPLKKKKRNSFRNEKNEGENEKNINNDEEPEFYHYKKRNNIKRRTKKNYTKKSSSNQYLILENHKNELKLEDEKIIKRENKGGKKRFRNKKMTFNPKRNAIKLFSFINKNDNASKKESNLPNKNK